MSVVERSLVLPPGTNELVCDELVCGLPRSAVTAVVVGNRLLILPVRTSAIGSDLLRVEPDQTVWDLLALRGCVVPRAVPVHVSNRNVEPALDATSTDRGSDDGAPLHFVDALAATARSLRAGVAGSVSIEAVAVQFRPSARGCSQAVQGLEPTARPLGRSAIRCDVRIEPGEFVVVPRVEQAASWQLVRVLAGVEQVDDGLLFHHGLPCDRNDPEFRHFLSTCPGIHLDRIGSPFRRSVVEEVAYPMLSYGVAAETARSQAASLLNRVLDRSWDGFSVDDFDVDDRRVVSLVRALAGPWAIRVLADPFSGVSPSRRDAVRQLLIDCRRSGSTIVVLTDDPEISGLADRYLVVDQGRVRSVRPGIAA